MLLSIFFLNHSVARRSCNGRLVSLQKIPRIFGFFGTWHRICIINGLDS